ncbi:MAG TPA: hypothetical protein PL045_11660, partial [Chitinophagaceae bacterium]|nr:hypothetical protein [Chitinophagaceae bacterium]
MTQNILIEFNSDTKGIDAGTAALDKLREKDIEAAEVFEQNNKAFQERKKEIDKIDSSLRSYVADLLNAEKAAAGGFGVKGLEQLQKTVNSS